MGPLELQITKRAFEIHSRLMATSGPELQEENRKLKIHAQQLSARIKQLETMLASCSLLDASNPVTKILNFVCKAENVSREDVIADRRTINKVVPRQIIYYLCCKLTDCSLPAIGKVIRKDHTTIMHGRDKITALMQTDEVFRKKIEAYIRAIMFKDCQWPV